MKSQYADNRQAQVGICTRISPRPRRARRLGWLMVLMACAANALLFLALSWINRVPLKHPESVTYTTMEIFPAELPLEDVSVAEDTIPQLTDIVLDRPQLSSLDAPEREPELFEPRLTDWTPQAPVAQLPLVRHAIQVPTPETGAAPARPAGPLSLTQVDKLPRQISGRPPLYPYWARVSGAEGTVTLRFLVDEMGNVTAIEVQSVQGDPRFGRAARQAVAQWKFTPAVYGNKPVSVWCIQRVNFKLDY